MLTKDVIAYFGGVKKTADRLGIWPAAIYAWPKNVPFLRALQIEKMTDGALKAPTIEEKISTDRLKIDGYDPDDEPEQQEVP